MMERKRVFFEIAAWILTIVCLLLLLEFSFRVWHKTSGHPVWVSDSFRGYRHSANNRFVYNFDGGRVANVTDENGFIGKGLSQEKKPSIRVIVLGDSFTEAVQVPWEQNYCSVLEEQLNKPSFAPDKNVTVINAGVSGYSPIDEYQYFRRELKKFRPDMVVLQMFPNDVFEDHKARAMGVMDDNGMPLVISTLFRDRVEVPDEKSWFFNIKEFLLKHSCLAESINRRFYRLLKKTKLQKAMNSQPEYDNDHQMFIIDESSALFKDASFREALLADTFLYVKALRQEVESAGAGFSVMLIPHEAQLPLKRYNRHVDYYFKNPPAGTFFNDRLAKFCQEEGIPFLDFKTVFEQHITDDLYWPEDGHLRPMGHQLVGETLARFVEEQYHGGRHPGSQGKTGVHESPAQL